MTPPTPSPPDGEFTLALEGHRHVIAKNPGKKFQRPVFAAGAVLWRGAESGVEVAVVHRPHRGDWSLPKGKVDPGEALATTAVREIAEETGYRAALGVLLGHITYPVGKNTKVVYYWAAQVLGGEFAPNDEVDELRWLSIEQADQLLTYPADRAVLQAASTRIAEPTTATVLYVRHASAGDADHWAGDDNARPLDAKGKRQADFLVPLLRAYHPTRLFSALPQRCQSTVQPLADALDLPMVVNPLLGDEGIVSSPAAARQALQDVVRQGGVSVVSAQGGVIPALVTALLVDAGFEATAVRSKKASVWALHFRNTAGSEELIGADYLATPLPLL